MNDLQIIAEQILDGECVLFLGNDATHGFPDLAPPSSRELARALADHLDRPPARLNLAAIAQRFQMLHGRAKLIKEVQNLLQNPRHAPDEVYTLLAEISPRIVVVTGYDELFERALLDQKRGCNHIVSQTDVTYLDEEKTSLIYLNGRVDRPESLILTNDDLSYFGSRSRVIIDLLRYLVQTKTLLFVDYDFEDDNDMFRRHIRLVTPELEPHRRRAFVVHERPDPVLREHWRANNVKFVETPTLKFIRELRELLRRKSRATGKRRIAPTASRRDLPFKFLDPFGEDDADLFFGRDDEARRMTITILYSHFATLFGPSGAGKTSLLRAGVAWRLREYGFEALYVRALDDPLLALKEALLELPGNSKAGVGISDADLSLFDLCQKGVGNSDRLVLMIDQGEELFRRMTKARRQHLWQELAALERMRKGNADSAPDVRVVFSLREDFLPQLDEVRGSGLEPFGAAYRLTNLNEDKAFLVVHETMASSELTIEHDLVEVLIGDISNQGEVAPPQLQIVCDRLFRSLLLNEEVVAHGATPQLREGATLSLADYRRLGGAERILAEYVDSAVAQLPHGQRELARAILKVLVTSQSRKAALTGPDLMERLAELQLVDAADLNDRRLVTEVRAGLQRVRLLRGYEQENAVYYELAHDYIGKYVGGWLSEEETERKLARELLRREVESWRLFADRRIDHLSLAIIYEQRDQLALSPEEAELLFRSALTTDSNVKEWLDISVEWGQQPLDILRDELDLSDYRQRVTEVTVMAHLGEAYLEQIAYALGDIYPQVRVAAIKALYQMKAPVASQLLATHLEHECFVEAGEFVKGTDTGIEGNIADGESPAQRLYLEDFFIDRCPVTNRAYRRFLEANPNRDSPPSWTDRRYPEGTGDHPVTHVSWGDARSYAVWVGKDLPTDGQWEKAARGKDARSFPWGSALGSHYCNTIESRQNKTMPVGSYSPRGDSPYAVVDMSGNVWEWTASRSDLRTALPTTGATETPNPTPNHYRVLRGGSFRYPLERATTFSRFSRHPHTKTDDIGFRCVLNLGTNSENGKLNESESI